MQVLERWEEGKNSGIQIIVWRIIKLHVIIEDNHNAFCYNERYDLEKNFHEWYRMCDVKNPYDEWINGIVFIIPNHAPLFI